MEGGAVGHNFERDHPCQVWFNLVQRFRGEDLNVIFYQNTVEFVYNEVQGTLDLISSYFVIAIVRYKRNNVELPPLLKNDVFQVMCNCFVCFVLLFFDR